MTVPGISYYSALLILCEIVQIGRFKSAKHLCSYAGLVPSVYSSGSKSFHGRITKQGSRWLHPTAILYLFLRRIQSAPLLHWQIREGQHESGSFLWFDKLDALRLQGRS